MSGTIKLRRSSLCVAKLSDYSTACQIAQHTTIHGLQERQQAPFLLSHRLPLSLFLISDPLPGTHLHWGERLTETLVMVYDWEGKREICYQMYIKDKKALEEIMEYMRNVYQFSPRYAQSPVRFVSHS